MGRPVGSALSIVVGCAVVVGNFSSVLAAEPVPILRFDFTGGSSANTGSGLQTAAAQDPGTVTPAGGLDGTGSYQNHAPPADGVNFQSQTGRMLGQGLPNELRSITVTMWLKAEVPFANSQTSNVPFFDTAGFSFASRELPAQSALPGAFGVSTGNSTQPVVLFDHSVPSTPDFGPGDVGSWRFLALTLDMVLDAGVTTTTVNLYRGSLTEPVALWGTGSRTQDGDRTTEINNAFGIGNNRNGDNFSTQRQFLGEIDDVRFYGSGSPGEAVLGLSDLEQIRAPKTGSTSFIRGDCNGDGKVIGQLTDAIALLGWIFLGDADPPCLAACDVNGDGKVAGSVTDALFLLQFNFLGGAAPPAPFPECGPGTASDEAIGCALPPATCR